MVHVIAIATDGNEDIQHHADVGIYVPKTPHFLQAVLASLPLQLLAYRIARLRGLNVDQPRYGGQDRYRRVTGVALVTGAGTGIGLAISERLVSDGWALGFATHERDDDSARSFERLRETGTRSVWVDGDLSDPAVPERLVAEVAEALGGIDALVNNAGVTVAKPLELSTATSTRSSPSTCEQPSCSRSTLRGGWARAAVRS